MTYKSIKEWSEDEQPREKLAKWGAQTLSLSELIAIIIATGSKERSAIELSKELLNLVDNDVNKLAKLSLEELQQVKGIGMAKAISIMAAIELSRRRKSKEVSQKIEGVQDVVNFYQPLLQDKSTEEFHVLLLARNNKIIKNEQIGKGGISEVSVDPKVIFKSALLNGASAIVLAHNHPSGNTKASTADRALTKKIKEASRLMDIKLLDHIIIAGDDYFSFSQEGLL